MLVLQLCLATCLCNGVRLCLWTATINGPIVHPPDNIWVCRAPVEWYWQEKHNNAENDVILPLWPPLIPHGLTRARTWVSEVRFRRLTAWYTAWSSHIIEEVMDRSWNDDWQGENEVLSNFLLVVCLFCAWAEVQAGGRRHCDNELH
jgi:hypothetical protein